MTNVTSTQNILARLENLKFWQDEQQKILEQKQLTQRQTLSNEQSSKIYEMMATSSTSSKIDGGQDVHSGIDEIAYSDEENPQLLLQSPLRLESSTKSSDKQHPLYKALLLEDEYQPSDGLVAKQPYLRRGEGLQRRFKVDPDVFKLHNLPKYKYARKAAAKKVGGQKAKTVKKVQPTPKVDHLKLKPPPPVKPVINSPSTDEPPLKWAEILDPHTIEPIKVPAAAQSCSIDETSITKTDDMSIFQLLEKRTASNSFNSQSSSILQLLDSNRKKQPVSVKPTDPLLDEKLLKEHHGRIRPHPSTIKDISFFSDDSVSEAESSSSSNDSKLHVKFSDKVEILDRTDVLSTDDDEEATLKPDEHDGLNLSKTSTPNDKDTFAAFKMQLFRKPSPPADHEKEIIEKSGILKDRLAELQSEINNFRTQSVLLTKAKQDHELEKLQWENMREEIVDQMKDEKIQLEMYLHDERQKCEKRWQELQKPTRKERDETVALKAKVVELEQELKNREIKHSASQARFRTQLKGLERENREQSLEIDVLKKESKKLEAENARLRRQSNTKMLQEINKNIAKLALPQEPEPEKAKQPLPMKRSKTPPVMVAKVISHQKILPANPRRVSKESVATPKASSSESEDSAPEEVAQTEKRKRPSKRSKQPIAESPATTGSSSDESAKELQQNARKSSYFKFLKSTEKSKKQNHVVMTAPSNDSMDVTTPNFAVDNSKVSSTPTSQHKQQPSPIIVHRHSSSSISVSVKKNSVQFQEPAVENMAELTDRATETLQNYKREIFNEDGSKDIWYPNGNIKKISADGLIVKMLYYNKDIKETNVNEGTVKYYYAQTNTWHTTYVDGLEILEFPNGQTEHHYKDGSIEIHFPNGSICITNPLKREIEEEWKYPNGTHVDVYKNGEKILSLPNGQREIHTKDHKRREYPDGTVKLVYPDGSQETRYSDGRIRLKDKDGKLITDTEHLQSTRQ